MRRFASTVVTAVCLVIGGGPFFEPTHVLAQATAHTTLKTTVPPAAYEAAVDLAFQEFETGNYAEARTHFLEAYQLFPNARVLRAIAKTEYELKNYPAAIDFLDQSLASSVRPLTPAQRGDALRLLEQARGYVGRYRILTVPEQTTLRLDGVETRLGADGTLVLPVGEHTIEAQATGYQPARRAFQVLGRTNETIRLELLPLEPEPSLAEADQAGFTPEPAPRVERTPLRKKWWVWTGVAAVAAASVATGVVLSRRESPSERLPTIQIRPTSITTQ